jgi:hypothetical protein
VAPWENPWPSNVILVELDENGEATVSGDLTKEGEILPDLSWAAQSNVACWPTVKDAHFKGRHVFYALKNPQPKKSILTVEAIPKAGTVDVNLYGIRTGSWDYQVPPAVYSVQCEASFGQTLGTPPNPGKNESIEFMNPTQNAYNILIAAAGHEMLSTAGAYDLKFKLLTSAPTCESPSPFTPPPTKWPSNVNLVSIEAGQPLKISGDLEQGEKVCPLDWAWSSGFACFPETKKVHFEGNHVFYAFDKPVPPKSVLNITVTPDPGVDVNIYGTRDGINDFYTPPFYTTGAQCEASYHIDLADAPNPGQPQTIQFMNPGNNPYNIFFAVAGYGADGTKGGYSIDASLQVAASANCSVPSGTPTAWPLEVNKVDLGATGAGKQTINGNLSSGKKLCSLEWAAQSNVACFPSTEDTHFTGNHVQYALAKVVPPKSKVTIKATPAAGVDVNLYGWWAGVNDFYTPPYLPSVGACEASYPLGIGTPTNPGQPEQIEFLNPTNNTYNYYFAVAGHDGATTGAYTLDVEVTTAPPDFCDQSLPGSSYSAWPASVTQIDLDDTGTGKASGNLSSGACTHLGFASKSNVACFPSTEDDQFQGNHVYFALKDPLPPRSEVTITAKPKPGVDVNLYGWLDGKNDFQVPPYVLSVPTCEASYPLGLGDGPYNPGEPQSISFQNPSTKAFYNVFFGVAGSKGFTSGAFDVDVKVTTATPHCPQTLPGSTYQAWPPSVKKIDLQGSLTTVKGNLSQGSCVNLDWAAQSNVACFPTVRDYLYEGNHVFYALSSPVVAPKEVTIAVQPDPGVDVNIYGWLDGQNSFQVPPMVNGVVTCEASYPVGIAPPPNPGQTEIITFSIPAGNGPYNLFLGVAGNNENGTQGGYTIYVQTKP